MLKSKALEVNLAHTQVEVVIDPRYKCLQQVMTNYYGLQERLNLFLKEVSHPYKNWQFIIDNARGFALDYFHLFKSHPKGPEAVQRLIGLFCEALSADTNRHVRINAVDNLLLYLDNLIKETEETGENFHPIIADTFQFIYNLPNDTFKLFVHSYFDLKRLAQRLYETSYQSNYQSVNHLLARYFSVTYNYWGNEADPMAYFIKEAEISTPSPKIKTIFAPITHQTLASVKSQLKQICEQGRWQEKTMLNAMLDLVSHHDIAKVYLQVPDQLLQVGSGNDPDHRRKVIFLFQAMNIPGLAGNHENILRDINRTLNWLIANQKPRYVHVLIKKTFSILKSNATRFPSTAVTCVDNMGREIFETGNRELIDYFIDATIDLGFQQPMIKGVEKNWQIQSNSAHIQNIRTWMNLIQLQPKKSIRLLSNLIIHLAVSGVLIKDTDLFGRDITRFLNSNIAPVYNLCKQLARLLPVYFNDIGAEGELREISTRIDEICHRRDPLIHFLRKQSHVESSNRILGFMEAVLTFWKTKTKAPLESFIPPNIYNCIGVRGPYVDGLHKIVNKLATYGEQLPIVFKTISKDELKQKLKTIDGVTSQDRERIILFAQLYQQLNNKYTLGLVNIGKYIDKLPSEAFPELEQLKMALVEPEPKKKLLNILNYLHLLKSQILSPQNFEVEEHIYKKRHFTVDIPSMYGSYREKKFDAMGLTLRLETLANVLLEESINSIELSLITKATCYAIYDRLILLNKALKIDGIHSAELTHHLELLSHSMGIRGFSFTQYLDIFKGLAQAVKNIINDYFNNIHGEHLTQILSRLPVDQVLDKYCSVNGAFDTDKRHHRISEIFLRDRLAMSLGLQQLDLFLSRIMNTLYHQSNKLPKKDLRRLLNYDPQRTITSISNPNSLTEGIIYLGNKGLNMMRLHRFGFPIPPGFIITTEVFRCCDIIESFKPAQDNFREKLVKHIHEIEIATGKRFGYSKNPLLFSVRSGSSISQPGMMETFLNVGMNEQITHGLASKSKNEWFAWDNYRRFLQCYGMALGLQRNDFDAIMADFKKKTGVPLKKEFSGKQMKHVAKTYKKYIQDEGYHIPEDPMAQLHATIQAVIDSWDSAKAKTYRRIMGISDDWGTAITIQAMVFGNISKNSGTGVIFTHNPRWAGDHVSLWGDFTLANQGEDVVSGLVNTLPISIRQQEFEMRDTDMILETDFPEIYSAMQHISHTLVSEKGLAPQEIEFTFEGPTADRLQLLQTRNMAIREHRRVLTFDLEEKSASIYLGHGIGVSGGAMYGRLVFTLEEVEYWRKKESQTKLILVRGDTVPDDIKETHAADGLLTAKGGVTSHASVIAHRLGKTCVVGCGNMICDEAAHTVSFARQFLSSGDFISIDGREGSVFKGKIKTNTPP